MNNIIFSKYNSIDLLSLVDEIGKDYYDIIEALCKTSTANAKKLTELEIHQPTSQYILLCNKLVTEISEYIENRKGYFIDYIKELHEKQEASHNCSNCSGKCHLQHDAKLMELTESHMRIKEILSRLQMMSLPLHSETIYPDAYRVLRNQMVLLENSLTELYFIEGTYMIPKVMEAQKKINARS